MTRIRKSDRRPRWIAVVALAAVLIGGLAFHVQSSDDLRAWLTETARAPRFHLAVVEFIGLKTLIPAMLLQRAGLNVRIPLIDLDLDVLIENLSSHRRVASCIAARIPPDRLVVEIEERVPIARLAGRHEGVSVDGARFELVADEGDDLTSVRGDVKWALPLLRAARELGITVATVDVRSPTDLRIRPFGQDIRVRIGPDPEASLRAWLRIRSSGLLERYKAREVDLRFPGSVSLRKFRNIKQGGEDGSS